MVNNHIGKYAATGIDRLHEAPINTVHPSFIDGFSQNRVRWTRCSKPWRPSYNRGFGKRRALSRAVRKRSKEMGECSQPEVQQAIAQALAAGGFANAEQAAWEVSLTVALSKVSEYERECGAFRSKYGESLADLKGRVEPERGRENFVVEDDLADWEFAEAALIEWKHRTEVLRRATP